MRKSLPISLCAALTALTLTACGGDDDESSTTAEPATKAPASGGGSATGGGSSLALSADADGALVFDKTSLSTKAGEVTITLKNPASVPHDVAIEGNGIDEKSPLAQEGDTVKVSATLEAGTYDYYCSVPGHRQAGMEGTLKVE